MIRHRAEQWVRTSKTNDGYETWLRVFGNVEFHVEGGGGLDYEWKVSTITGRLLKKRGSAPSLEAAKAAADAAAPTISRDVAASKHPFIVKRFARPRVRRVTLPRRKTLADRVLGAFQSVARAAAPATPARPAIWTSADVYGLYKLDGMTVDLARVRLNRGGYTSSGRYYGTGAPLFTAYGEEGGVYVDLRAKDRATARALIKRFAPNAKVGR